MTPTCVLVHPVGTTCNIACSYCFYRNTNMRDFSRKMSVEMFMTFYKNWVQTIPDNIESDIIWHGGEPTLRGTDFFEDVLSQSKFFTPSEKKVRHCIQTNGVSINREWVKIFKKHQILVGVSLDGPKEINDQLRIFQNGDGTFTRVMRAYNMLKDEKINVGIVVVVNKYNVKQPNEIFQFLKDHKIKRLQLSPCLECNDPRDNYSISNSDFANFICRLYDLWLNEDDPEISIGFINDIIDSLLGKQCHNCMLSDNCRNFMVLNWNGDIKSCDGMRSRQENIGLVEICQPKKIFLRENWDSKYQIVSQNRTDTCGECQWFEICHGGCPYHWQDDGPAKTGFCEAHKEIFSHIASSIRSIYGEL